MAGFTWTVDFGDETPVEMVAAGTATPLTRTHTFASGGIFTVKATAMDRDGGVSAATAFPVNVSGPNAL